MRRSSSPLKIFSVSCRPCRTVLAASIVLAKKRECISIASITEVDSFVHSFAESIIYYLQWDILLEDLRREEGSDSLYSSVNEHYLGSVDGRGRRSHINRNGSMTWRRWWQRRRMARTWSSLESALVRSGWVTGSMSFARLMMGLETRFPPNFRVPYPTYIAAANIIIMAAISVLFLYLFSVRNCLRSNDYPIYTPWL